MRLLVAAAVMVAARAAAADPLVPEQVSAQIGKTSRDLVVLTDGAHLWMPVAALCSERLCPEPTLVRNEVGYVDLSAMRDQLHYAFDEDAGTLKIAIHADALPVTELKLASLAPKNLEYISAPSLFVNYSLEASYDLRSHAEGLGFTEIGAGDHDVLVYSTITGSTPGAIVRGISNVSIDRRESLRRYTFGDDVVIGGLLGGGGVLGGVHVTRDFSLDPYFVAQPTLTQTGVVSAPSTVEVYRDGQLVRREVIPAGPFRIQDLTNAPSADTQVIVKDPFGATQMVMTAQILPPATALRPGLSQYDYSIGFVRRSLAVDSFDYGPPAALFVHRLGITNALTVGVRAEGTYDRESSRGSSGGSLTFTHDRLDIEASGALSESSQGTSGAGSLDIGWRLPHATVAGLVRVVGKHYSTVDLGPDDSRATFETGGTLGWSPMPNVSVSTQLTYQRLSENVTRERASGIAGFALYDMRASVSAGVSHSNDGSTGIDAMFTLSKSLGAHTTATAGATYDGGGPAFIANVGHSVTQNRGVGFDAQIRAGENSSGDVIVDAEHDYGRATATVDWFGSVLRGSVGIAGGIVAIGGEVKATRPVLGSFALVRVPGAANVHTFLDNHPVGTTDSDGDLVVPELQSAYANRLRIDVRDLPLDIATDSLERLVGPPRRGGAIVEFASAHTAIVNGNIGSPIDFSFGELVIDGEHRAPIGHEARFEIDNITPGQHHGVVELDDQHCGFDFTVPALSNLVELGRVKCTTTKLGMR